MPSGVTTVERRAVKEAVEQAGAKYVLIVEEAMAAAIGAGLPTLEPIGSMIVDIASRTSEPVMLMVSGSPFRRFLPLISMASSRSIGNAEPI